MSVDLKVENQTLKAVLRDHIARSVATAAFGDRADGFMAVVRLRTDVSVLPNGTVKITFLDDKDKPRSEITADRCDVRDLTTEEFAARLRQDFQIAEPRQNGKDNNTDTVDGFIGLTAEMLRKRQAENAKPKVPTLTAAERGRWMRGNPWLAGKTWNLTQQMILEKHGKSDSGYRSLVAELKDMAGVV